MDEHRTGTLARRLRAALLAIGSLLASLGGVCYVTAPPLPTVATAVLTNGRSVDVAIHAGGRVEFLPPQYSGSGHAPLPAFRRDLPQRITHTMPIAPDTGWRTSAMRRLESQQPLRVCWEQIQDKPQLVGIVRKAALDTFTTPFVGVPAQVENCRTPDIIYALGPESPVTGCGTPLALGCARLDGERVIVTFRDDLPQEAIYWVLRHENKHAAGLGHTGWYGNERKPHDHCSDMGLLDLGGTNRPVDNPAGELCVQDWHLTDAADSPLRFGLRPRTALTPTPTPTATATATATPTPYPPPPTPQPPPPTAPAVQVWVHHDDGDCMVENVGEWIVITCATDRFWYRWTKGETSTAFTEQWAP